MLLVLAAATFVEKQKGTDFAHTYIYGSWIFVALWFVIAASALFCIVQTKMYKQPMFLLLHIALMVMLTGALLTFTTAKRGSVHLRLGKSLHSYIDKKDRVEHRLPFEIILSSFNVDYYPGTEAPSDYVSEFKLIANGEEVTGRTSMNTVFSKDGFRFYQSGYDADMQGSILLVKQDRYGLPVTYLGYILLLIGMVGYFFEKNTDFRKLLRHPALKQTMMMFLFCCIAVGHAMAGNTKALSKETAQKMGKLQMLYHDRICPVQTFATDFTLKLYGKSSYKSLIPEQILSGYLFYPADWIQEPIIRIKDETVQKILGIDGKYASFSDCFEQGMRYKLAEHLRRIRLGEEPEAMKEIIATDEKVQLLFMLLQQGALLKIFPVTEEGKSVWYSPEDALPDNLSDNEQLLIQSSLTLLGEYAQENDMKEVDNMLDKLMLFQKKSGGRALLSERKIAAECLYNTINKPKPVAFLNLTVGLLALMYCFGRALRKNAAFSAGHRAVSIGLNTLMTAVCLFLVFLICIRGYVSNHIPLGNGYETMQFLAICILLLAFFFQRKIFIILPFGFLFSGLVLLVSGIGGSNPQITQLQPVLSSPLLSIHVSLIMMAYSLFGFIALNALSSFLLMIFDAKHTDTAANRQEQLTVVSRILLYPGVFLLAAGIFIGAVWAEVSWGRYWSWDPKETWALITLIVYALPLYLDAVPLFKRVFFFHFYTLIAFSSVLMTYFGVNYLLGGMHSYGGESGINSFLLIIVLIVFIFCIIPAIALVNKRSAKRRLLS
jgi:ABC-type transport system involved in cytochrome c biogenesis permease subunit